MTPCEKLQSHLTLSALLLGIGLSVVTSISMAGPGTQTEDDVYVGNKRQVQGVNTPGTTVLQPRPGATVSPNTGAISKKEIARTGGDDDLDDLEVERRKVQGVNLPGTTTLPPRPNAGTSPNTGRSAPLPFMTQVPKP